MGKMIDTLNKIMSQVNNALIIAIFLLFCLGIILNFVT